jgi:serine phosphatase RsbU (regulator of sigma subunit)
MKRELSNSLESPLWNSDRQSVDLGSRLRDEPGGRTVLATHATVSDAVALHEELASYITVLEQNEPVARHPIGLEPLTVGRDSTRDIVLPDAQVSRLHLQLLLVNGEVVVEDLGSSNGTFFAGQRLIAPAVLPPGSWVQVGSRVLKHERRSKREIEREEELRRDLEKARSYVQSLLPARIESGPIRADWFFCPSTQLGGDAFSYDFLDDEHVAAYLIDVSGHGAGAAMHSVTVLNVLRQRALPGTDFRDPAQVLRNLNAMFPMDTHDGLYFTIWYGVYSRTTRRLCFSAGGHHPGFLFARGAEPVPLCTRGLMIGAVPEPRYVAGDTNVPPGAALYLFSDGAFEITDTDGRPCGLDEFLPLLAGEDDTAGKAERIYRAVRRRAKPGPLDDDFSVLILRFD